MQAMRDEVAQAVSPGVHGVVLMDRAGRHIAKDLAVPANLTPLFLPPYSPELNAIEQVWIYLRERFLSHTASDPPTTTSSMPAVQPATRCSPRPAAFAPPSAPSLGPRRSALNQVGMRRRANARRFWQIVRPIRSNSPPRTPEVRDAQRA
jgi:DDE superfamily endonuclease